MQAVIGALGDVWHRKNNFKRRHRLPVWGFYHWQVRVGIRKGGDRNHLFTSREIL